MRSRRRSSSLAASGSSTPLDISSLSPSRKPPLNSRGIRQSDSQSDCHPPVQSEVPSPAIIRQLFVATAAVSDTHLTSGTFSPPQPGQRAARSSSMVRRPSKPCYLRTAVNGAFATADAVSADLPSWHRPPRLATEAGSKLHRHSKLATPTTTATPSQEHILTEPVTSTPPPAVTLSVASADVTKLPRAVPPQSSLKEPFVASPSVSMQKADSEAVTPPLKKRRRVCFADDAMKPTPESQGVLVTPSSARSPQAPASCNLGRPATLFSAPQPLSTADLAVLAEQNGDKDLKPSSSSKPSPKQRPAVDTVRRRDDSANEEVPPGFLATGQPSCNADNVVHFRDLLAAHPKAAVSNAPSTQQATAQAACEGCTDRGILFHRPNGTVSCRIISLPCILQESLCTHCLLGDLSLIDIQSFSVMTFSAANHLASP